jgi:hypothetical protein
VVKDPAPRFPLGQVVLTSSALQFLSAEDIASALRRHAAGDWGEVDAEDREANERGLRHGERLLSVYRSAGGVRFYVITERDRSLTTVLLPEDY